LLCAEAPLTAYNPYYLLATPVEFDSLCGKSMLGGILAHLYHSLISQKSDFPEVDFWEISPYFPEVDF
jgi:hypothetical protein